MIHLILNWLKAHSKKCNLMIAFGVVGGYLFLMIASADFFYAGFALALIAFPLVIHIFLILAMRCSKAQFVLMAGYPVYFTAFLGLFIYIFYFIESDALNGLMLLITGFISLPFMLVIWIYSYKYEIKFRSIQQIEEAKLEDRM